MPYIDPIAQEQRIRQMALADPSSAAGFGATIARSYGEQYKQQQTMAMNEAKNESGLFRALALANLKNSNPLNQARTQTAVTMNDALNGNEDALAKVKRFNEAKVNPTQVERNETFKAGNKIKVNGQVAGELTKATDDPLAQQFDRQITAADKLPALFDPNAKTPPQTLKEAANDVANMISGQNGAALATINGQEYNNWASKSAEFLQKITNGVIDVNAPEVKQQLMDTAARVRNEITKAKLRRFDTITAPVASQYADDPTSVNAIKATRAKLEQDHTVSQKLLQGLKPKPTPEQAAEILRQRQQAKGIQ